MNPVTGFFATSGPLALGGAALGWVLFQLFATTSPTCAAIVESDCTQLMGMTFLPFVGMVAAVGGLVGLVIAFAKP